MTLLVTCKINTNGSSQEKTLMLLALFFISSSLTGWSVERAYWSANSNWPKKKGLILVFLNKSFCEPPTISNSHQTFTSLYFPCDPIFLINLKTYLKQVLVRFGFSKRNQMNTRTIISLFLINYVKLSNVFCQHTPIVFYFSLL